MIIEQIAKLIFEKLANNDIVVAILGRDGSFIANKPEIFSKVFSDHKLLKELCVRIDDGCEPLISQVNSHTVAASDLSTDSGSIGFVVMLLPGNSPEKSIESHDFIEIILEQFSLIAALVELNQQITGTDRIEAGGFSTPIFASMN
jgi:hypothetical protein